MPTSITAQLTAQSANTQVWGTSDCLSPCSPTLPCAILGLWLAQAHWVVRTQNSGFPDPGHVSPGKGTFLSPAAHQLLLSWSGGCFCLAFKEICLSSILERVPRLQTRGFLRTWLSIRNTPLRGPPNSLVLGSGLAGFVLCNFSRTFSSLVREATVGVGLTASSQGQPYSSPPEATHGTC